MEYNILDICLHHTDFEKGSIEEGDETKEDVSIYIKSIINDTLQNNKTRFYKIKRNTTEVIRLINEIIRNDVAEVDIEESDVAEVDIEESDVAACVDIFSKNSISIVKCLLDAESKGNTRAINLKNKVKKGSLIQAKVVNAENETLYVLAKVDYTKILDKKDSVTREGLPLEQKALKTGILKYDEEYNISEIMLYDSKGNISEYWYSDFLNVEKMNSDEQNTLKCFECLDRTLKRAVKSKSPFDYWQMYNGVVQYFKQNRDFDYDDMFEKVFNNYEIIEKELLNKEDILSKIKELPTKQNNKFEKNFTIKQDSIKNKKQKTIQARREIDIIYKDSIENLKEVMFYEKMENGKYAIKIIVEEEIINKEFKKITI